MATNISNIGTSVPKPVRLDMDNYRRNSSASMMTFPTDLGVNSMLMVFRKYEYTPAGTIGLNSLQRGDRGNSVVQRGLDAVNFPIPTNLQDQNEARLGRFDMRYLGDVVAQSFNREDFVKMTSADGAELYNMIKGGNKDVMDEAAYLARFAGSDFARAFSAGRGVVANPKASLVYEGHEFKLHSFVWNLAPRSEADSIMLKNITDVIKRNQLPATGGRVATMTYLRYPSIVDLYLLGVDQNFFYKFKPAMLRSFNINYSGQNAVSILRGGRPANVTIEMNFIETDIHYSHEYGGSIVDDVDMGINDNSRWGTGSVR